MATTLAAGMLVTDTVATLNAGHDPVATGDTLQIGTEKMRVTGSAGADAFNVSRGSDSTTAAAHTTGDPVTVIAATSICAQIAPGGVYPGFMPVPSYVFLGTCADSSSEPTWVQISNVESINIGAPSTAQLDVTNLNNPTRYVQQIAGLTTPGDVTLTVHYWPDDPTHCEETGLIHLSQTKEVRPYRIVCLYDHSDTTKQLMVTFAGWVSSLPLNFSGSAVMNLVVTIRQYGALTVEHGNDLMPVSAGSQSAKTRYGNGNTLMRRAA
jgi:hypothetical protein